MLRVAALNPSLMAQRYLNLSSRDVESALSALASGSRFSKPANDAAGFAISESLKGQIAGTKQAARNGQSAISMIQTAEGGLNEQHNILIRMRELAVQAGSGTYDNYEREMIDLEFQQLNNELDRIAKTTVYGQKSLLTGTGQDFEFQVGTNDGDDNIIGFSLDADTTARNLNVYDLSLYSARSARKALSYIDEGMKTLGSARASFGAMQSRLQHSIDHLNVQADNLEVARSLVADVDVGEQMSKLTSAQVRREAGISVLAQANQAPGAVLRLIA